MFLNLIAKVEFKKMSTPQKKAECVLGRAGVTLTKSPEKTGTKAPSNFLNKKIFNY